MGGFVHFHGVCSAFKTLRARWYKSRWIGSDDPATREMDRRRFTRRGHQPHPAKLLADTLDALDRAARKGDARARAELQAAYTRAHNPVGPDDHVWQEAWRIHTERGRPRRERQSRRYLARLHVSVTPARVRRAVAPQTRRREHAPSASARTISAPADSDSGPSDDDPPSPALRRGLVPRARAPPWPCSPSRTRPGRLAE